jgi:hypothetical protein
MDFLNNIVTDYFGGSYLMAGIIATAITIILVGSYRMVSPNNNSEK